MRIILFLFPFFIYAQQAQKIQTTICVNTPNTKIKTGKIKVLLFENNKEVFEKTLSKSCLNFTTNKGIFKAIISSECCPAKEINWNTDSATANPFNFQVTLDEKSILLNEVKIKAVFQRFRKAGDTLVIRTTDVETRPHSDATSLFEEIEGLSIDEYGAMRIFGNRVEAVTIENNRIFGGDPSLTMLNIRSDMIEEMEFIEKQMANGKTKRVLNIKLKANRKKGIYGTIEAGIEPRKSFLGNAKINKIIKNGFLSSFATINNINQPFSNANDIMLSSYGNLKQEVMSTSTLMGLYTDPKMEGFDEDDKIDLSHGRTTLTSIGSNVSFGNKKKEMSIFFVANKNNQQFNQSNRSITNFENQRQNTNQNIDNKLFSKSIYLNINGKINLSKRLVFNYSNQTNSEKKQSNIEDSTLIKNFASNEVLVKSSSDKNQLISSNFLQGSLALQGKKKGGKQLLYAFHQYNDNESNQFSTFNIQTNSAIRRAYLTNNFGIEAIKSYAISNRIALEHRLSITNENVNFNQNSEVYKIRIDKQSIVNTPIDFNTYMLYQRPRWNAILDWGSWFFKSQRSNEVAKTNIYQQLHTIRLAKINFKLPAINSLSIGYSFQPETPLVQDVLNAPDSSSLFAQVNGNFDLKPVLKREFSLRAGNQMSKRLF
jgi:hypothetical protein